MDDVKLVKEITHWNRIGIRTKGRPKIRWRDEVIHYLEKSKLRFWRQLVNDRKAWNNLAQKTKIHVGTWCQKKMKKKKKKKKKMIRINFIGVLTAVYCIIFKVTVTVRL